MPRIFPFWSESTERLFLKIKPIILAEGLRASSLESLVGVPPLLLPIGPSILLLECWREKLEGYVEADSPLEILVASTNGFQSMDLIASDPRFKRGLDPRPHRGTAGVLSDYLERDASGSEGLDYLLVIERSSCPPCSLGGFMSALGAAPDILIGVSELDRLTGIMAIKPKILNLVPSVGYFDLKEQLVKKAVDVNFKVSASSIMPRSIPINSVASWIEAIRYLAYPDPAADSDRQFVVEGVSCIDPSATVGNAMGRDSIIMEGAVVGDGAVVARSVLCPGAEVASGARVIDSVIRRAVTSASLERRLRGQP